MAKGFRSSGGQKHETLRCVGHHRRETLFRVSVRSVNGVLRHRLRANGPANPAPTDYNVVPMTDPAEAGHGYASTLVRAALDDARAHETPIVPRCPHVADWIERHPDYADLIDTDLLARMESRS